MGLSKRLFLIWSNKTYMKKSYAIFIGSVTLSTVFIFQHYLHLPDFISGLGVGISIGIILLAFIHPEKKRLN
jgi:hypothetical protein